MNEALQHESEKLARSWLRHEAGWLRDYLVEGVEDPRVNVQSIIARHFLVRALRGDRFGGLALLEYRFAAAMNWLLGAARQASGQEELDAVLYGLRRGADNVEGIPIPAWVTRIFATLPARAGGIEISNYLERFLGGTGAGEARARREQEAMDTFCGAWAEALRPGKHAGAGGVKLSVLEPACGSANDYRFLERCGIAALIDYTGFDLCAKNVENARAMFPAVRFRTANVFAIEAADETFDCCVVHDLFEHLSPAGLNAAVEEVCRVTRKGLCAGFFQMDEIPQHVVRPVDEYHWNLLSMARMQELFARHGFAGQVLHVGSFLKQTAGCDRTHNPNAYTFLLERP